MVRKKRSIRVLPKTNDNPIYTEILTAEEAGKYLKVSKPFVVKLAKDGKVPATKLGRSWRFTRASLDNWIKKRLNEDAVLESCN